MNREFRCRVCTSSDLSLLPIGIYAPFFALRVDTSRDPFTLYSRRAALQTQERRDSVAARARRLIGRLGWGEKTEPGKHLFRTLCQCCAACGSISPCHEFSREELDGLYRDYRSERYNRDRISVEPGYAKIAQAVGRNPVERAARNAGVERFLDAHRQFLRGGALLDIGGSDGSFIPPSLVDGCDAVDILDPSDTPIHPSIAGTKVRKIASAAENAYSLLLCMHVLEHVGNPRRLLVEVMAHLRSEGLVYLEVPLEQTGAMREQFRSRVIDAPLFIHEHVNVYDSPGLRCLVESIAGLEVVACQDDVVDMGWAGARVSRCLARRTA